MKTLYITFMVVCSIFIAAVLLIPGVEAQQPQADRLAQLQSLANKIQGYLNICLQDSANEESLRIKLQQELIDMKKQLDELRAAKIDKREKE